LLVSAVTRLTLEFSVVLLPSRKEEATKLLHKIRGINTMRFRYFSL